jgi:sorbitol/mannitol transport system substrate-binding protein
MTKGYLLATTWLAALGFIGVARAETLTIATVNNGDMIRMQHLTDDFLKANPDIKLNWVTLEENVLRQKVTTDIATKGGQFDVLTIGTYETPIWAKKGWLVPLDKLVPTMTSTTFYSRSALVCLTTASSTRRLSTARAPSPCTAPT